LIYCFDIDGTICTSTHGVYEEAVPFLGRIDRINALFEAGHHIIFFTARGSTTQIDWYEFTHLQLTSWGLQFHSLQVGKPHADIFVDDLAVNSEEFAWDL